ncbi:MAG: hypothetical protein ABSC37_04695 [Xanthobacteraceae bacterium]
MIFFAIALRGGGPFSLDRKLGWELQRLLSTSPPGRRSHHGHAVRAAEFTGPWPIPAVALLFRVSAAAKYRPTLLKSILDPAERWLSG